MRPRWLAVSAALCCSLAIPARAAEHELSELETRTVARAARRHRLQREPHPEGKIVEEIVVHRLDVFDEEDPVPDFFNVFHAITLERVVRREVLFAVDERWDAARVDETARNLRALPQLSLVLIVPMRGSAPDRVRVLIITKDVWSLRINSDFQIADGRLLYLSVQPSEINAFGTHGTVGLIFGLRPDTLAFGATLSNPRIGGSRIGSIVSGQVFTNRDSGDVEGSAGSFYYGQPLYSVDTRWAWSTYVAWRDEIFRRYVGATEDTFDSELTPGDDRLPFEYRSERQYSQIEVTRSFGKLHKHDLSLGMEANRRAVRLDTPAPEVVREDFREKWMPRSDTRIGPFLQLEEHSATYRSLLDVDTLALQEDVKLGHDVLVRVYPAWADLGSTRTLLGTWLAASYTLALGDGFVRVLGGSRREFAQAGKTDGLLVGSTRIASPRFTGGRLVADGIVIDHYQNYLNDQVQMGGEGRLRGYPPLAFIGQHLAAASVELRTGSLNVLSAELGGAVFYDVGDAFDDFRTVRMHQDVGAGVRVLFPQAERVVMRADWGFPIADETYRTFPGALFITFGQAFGMAQVDEPPLAAASLVPLTR